MLRATTACNSSSLIWPAGTAPAALASLLFGPPEPQIIWKTQCFATLLPFRALDLLSSEAFSFLIFFPLLSSPLLSCALLFSSLLFFDSYHLCFSSVHMVRSLTSKLPSLIIYVFSLCACCPAQHQEPQAVCVDPSCRPEENGACVMRRPACNAHWPSGAICADAKAIDVSWPRKINDSNKTGKRDEEIWKTCGETPKSSTYMVDFSRRTVSL